MARNSFANCLKQKGDVDNIISVSMGHKNHTITQTYFKEFDNSILDEATVHINMSNIKIWKLIYLKE
ncbi:hypothetical protein ES711_07770 [Gelidibacter salicanalis]|uniref:Tyrosine-type recombinase/integrase n=1 Tax=Gelidibacter salicanalis TaxID=291193 RepID=A0A5C7AIJ2_9FLAO|nr:hypothetical protein [Gelidibacter salicanalis]TXE08398.1 hypothetical protein ES711_07770 [Gelidibacter salicanalis]